LERELGVVLLERDTHSVSLTAPGKLFAIRARSILEMADEAVTEVRKSGRGETGKISIAFIGSLGHELLPRLFQRFRQTFPDVQLELQETSPGEQIEQLGDERLDVGFIGMANEDLTGTLAIETLLEEPLVAAVPSDHPFAAKRSIRLSLLKDERFILTARRTTPVYNHWLFALCREAGFEPKITMEVDRAPTVLNYIAAGFGISIFPVQIAKHPIPGVTFVPTANGTPQYRYCVAWRKRDTSEVTARFLQVARQVARELKIRPNPSVK
jgi:DNA-binding transcriptional LysR family regulator